MSKRGQSNTGDAHREEVEGLLKVFLIVGLEGCVLGFEFCFKRHTKNYLIGCNLRSHFGPWHAACPSDNPAFKLELKSDCRTQWLLN
jgi:hypothetical protein